MLITIAIALIINNLVSACLLWHFFRHTESVNKPFLQYGIGYFACLILTFLGYLLRLFELLPLSVFFTNFFGILATCTLLFAMQVQLQRRVRPWLSLWLAYPVVVAVIATVLVVFLPDKPVLRSINLYIHNTCIYLAVLYVLSGHFHRQSAPHSKALNVGMAGLLLLSFCIPLVFVVNADVTTQHIALIGIQIVVAQVSLAVILMLLFHHRHNDVSPGGP